MNYNDNINGAEELKIKLQECRQKLLDILDDLYYMQNELEPQLNFIYDSNFGELEEELISKNLAAQELQRRIELFSKKLNRGEKLTDTTINFINSIVDKEFARRKSPAEPVFSSMARSKEQAFNIRYDKNSFDAGKIYRA